MKSNRPSRTSGAMRLGFRSYNYKQYKIVGHGGALRGFVSADSYGAWNLN